MRIALAGLVAALIHFTAPDPALAQPYPPHVQREVDKIVATCRQSGGTPRSVAKGVMRSALTHQGARDWVIYTGAMDCAGAMTVWGGTAGQTLILLSADGRGVRHLYAHNWRVDDGSPPVITIDGGIACAQGRHDLCTARLSWNGSSFEPVSGGARFAQASQTSGRSIVGDWAETPDGCRSPTAGLIRVGPKSLASDELSCRFRDVSRSGSTVRWTGTCDEGQGDYPVTVTATETNGRLMVRFGDGHSWRPLGRCPRRSS
jgi:hypothetical protein